MSEWYDYVRIGNIILAVVCVVLLLRKASLYWSDYQERTKDFWWVLMCWCMVIILGTSEVLLNWDTQFRVLFTCFALLLTLKVMWKPNEIAKPTFTNEL